MLISRVMASSSAQPGVLVKEVKHWLGSYCSFTSGVISFEDSKKKTSHAHWILISRVMAFSSAEPGVLVKEVKYWLDSYCRFTSGVISGDDSKKPQARHIGHLHQELRRHHYRTGCIGERREALAR